MAAVEDKLLFANNRTAQLAVDVAIGDPALILETDQGADWPVPVAGEYFVLTLQNLQTGSVEICHATARVGDTISVLRGQEGSTEQAFLADISIVQMRVTRGVLEKLIQQNFTAADANKYLQVQSDGRAYPVAIDLPEGPTLPVLAGFVGAAAKRTTDLDVPAETNVQLKFDTQLYDTSSIWNDVSDITVNRFYAPADGYYCLLVSAYWSSDPAAIGQRCIFVYRNSVLDAESGLIGSSEVKDQYQQVLAHAFLFSGEYFDVWVRATNATTLKCSVQNALATFFCTVGTQGEPGPPGTSPGVAAGGTAGQMLAKVDDTDFNTEWVTLPGVETPSSTGLLSGGGVAWLGNLDFHVNAATYSIQGVEYNSPATDVSLTTADPSLPRIDLIGVNGLSQVIVLTGTPSATPEKPDVDPAFQLELTFIYVAAAATVPSVSITQIYRENIEWTATKSGVPINLTSTTNPFAGTLNVEATAATTNNWAHFQTVTAFDPNTRDMLVLRIRSKATWPTTRQLNLTLRSGGTQRGGIVVLKQGTYSFDSSLTSAYQTILIPLTDFVAGGLSVNALRVTVGGSGATIGFHLDNLELQAGIATVPAVDSSRMRWRGNYSAAVAYSLNDVVLSAGTQYVCIAPSTGNVPATSPSFWQASTSGVMRFMRGAAFVSSVPLTVLIAPASVYFNTAAVLKKVVLMGDVVGDVQVDMKKIAVGSYDPAGGISMCGGDFPALVAAKQSEKTTFSGWTSINVAAGDVINFSLLTVTTLMRVTVQAFFEETP